MKTIWQLCCNTKHVKHNVKLNLRNSLEFLLHKKKSEFVQLLELIASVIYDFIPVSLPSPLLLSTYPENNHKEAS